MKKLLPLLLMHGCAYITQPETDPADPVAFSIVNSSPVTLYLTLQDGASLLDGGMRFTDGTDKAFSSHVGCRSVCSDGCGVSTCTGASAVRALAPGEAWLVDWDGMRFDEGSLSCAGEADAACVAASRAGRGRYHATVCYGTSFDAVDAQAVVRRLDRTLSPAVAHDPICLETFGFNYPSYFVRYEVELR